MQPRGERHTHVVSLFNKNLSWFVCLSVCLSVCPSVFGSLIHKLAAPAEWQVDLRSVHGIWGRVEHQGLLYHPTGVRLALHINFFALALGHGYFYGILPAQALFLSFEFKNSEGYSWYCVKVLFMCWNLVVFFFSS